MENQNKPLVIHIKQSLAKVIKIQRENYTSFSLKCYNIMCVQLYIFLM